MLPRFSQLVCPVRGCRSQLTVQSLQVSCELGHSFDISRSGYINLLQPQDRRSANPGDSAEAVQSRRRIHDLGVTQPLQDAIADLLRPSHHNAVLDAGCGDGFYLGSLQQRFGFHASGADISVAAINAAARRYPACEWIVANADRAIPYADASFSAVLSITARRNPNEFRRVLKNNGTLLLAIPAPDDLIELRGSGRDRVPAVIDEFAASFRIIEHRQATTAADLDAESVECIRRSVYRPLHSGPPTAMRLTFSLDLLLFAPL